MSASSMPSPLLTRLRRSTRMAVFMALVMVTKLVGGYACVGEGLPGVVAGDSTQQVTMVDDGFPAGAVLSVIDHADPQAVHVAGSCCHCSCHQATVLPRSESFAQVQARLAPLPTPSAAFIPTHLERELRPPIV